VNVPALVKSLIKEMKSEIDKRKEVVTELYSPNLPTLSADNSSLRMVLQNLLSNSVKYTAAGGNITVEAAVKSKGEIVDGQKINEDRFILRVADSGMGIPKGQQNKVFEKLFRADNARTLETEGTGLGLYVIKSIVDQSGGEIWFVSEENKGTTFIISYPLTGMKKVEKK
jgi:signal transduction histidine kinase